MIDVVQFHLCMCTPAPYKRLRLCSCVGSIPVNTLCCHFNSKFGKLVLTVLCQCLTNRIRCRIQHGKFCTRTVFLTDSVITFCPACCFKNFFCFIRIVFYFCFFIVPWHLVAHAVCRSSITVQNIFDHFFAVNANIDRTSYFYITGKVISISYSVNFLCRSCRKIKSTVVYRLHAEQIISVNRYI